MATTDKKKGSIVSKMGRPKQGGALSEYPNRIRQLILQLREKNPGWGSISILLELRLDYGYLASELPSLASTHNFLRQSGCIKEREPKSPLPLSKCRSSKRPHEKWELDAKGAVFVEGVGFQALIDIKDNFSKKYCMAFPVSVKNRNTQPRTLHYKWALRLAFIESGLPKAIQVDKDSVFIENSSKSPFPSRLHLWLLALGVELCFIDRPPPAMNSMVERSHQTIYNQALKGKSYKTWGSIYKNINKRRQRLNEHYPSRTLGKKAPIQVHPKAKHSGKYYSVQQEEQLLDLKRIYAFLAKGKWYRKVSASKGAHIGAKRYVLKKAKPHTIVVIIFCNRCKKFIFHDVKEQELGRHPIKELSIQSIMESTTAILVADFERILKARKFPL